MKDLLSDNEQRRSKGTQDTVASLTNWSSKDRLAAQEKESRGDRGEGLKRHRLRSMR